MGASQCSPTASFGTNAGCSGAAMVTGLYLQRTARSDIEARNAAAARCRCRSQSRKQKEANPSTKQASSMLRWRQTHQRNQRTQEVLPAAQTCRHIFVLQCSGSAHVESSKMDRPHNVTCILMRQMHLMLTTATPRRKTKYFIIVSASPVMMLMSEIMD